jgi:hypothetical protein
MVRRRTIVPAERELVGSLRLHYPYSIPDLHSVARVVLAFSPFELFLATQWTSNMSLIVDDGCLLGSSAV